jgi:hypothetical protein
VLKAQEAVRHASGDDSDEEERNQSVVVSRHVFKEYDKLLAGSPENSTDRAEVEAEFKEVIDTLKNDLYMSGRQRIWIAVHGWF